MPITPDRFPGTREEEELALQPASSDPTVVGAMRLVSGRYRLRDDLGGFDPREAASGISETSHKLLRQLIHFIDNGPAEGFASGAYREIIGGVFPTEVIWWESASKLKRIVDKVVTRSGGGATPVAPTPITWRVYDTDGTTVLATVADAIAYSGAFETSRTRTIT